MLGLVLIKAVILYLLGRWWGLDSVAARRLGLVISQGGEFAFVLFGAGVLEGVIGQHLANLLTLAVTLSMAATPPLLLIDDAVARALKPKPPDYEMPPEGDHHVIVAGFGRFGQIVARVLRARQIPFTALDSNVAQVDFVKRFGAQIYYGDAGRLDILRAAGADKARAFVLAIDNVDASLRVAEMVRTHFPDLPIYARARDRTHVHKLMDLGVTIIERETFLAALELTKALLRGLGLKEAEVRRLTETFKRLDEKRLYRGLSILYGRGEGAGQRALSGQGAGRAVRARRRGVARRRRREAQRSKARKSRISRLSSAGWVNGLIWPAPLDYRAWRWAASRPEDRRWPGWAHPSSRRQSARWAR